MPKKYAIIEKNKDQYKRIMKAELVRLDREFHQDNFNSIDKMTVENLKRYFIDDNPNKINTEELLEDSFSVKDNDVKSEYLDLGCDYVNGQYWKYMSIDEYLNEIVGSNLEMRELALKALVNKLMLMCNNL